MRDYEKECKNRVEWIQAVIKESHAKGVVFGNSGGKDSALVGALCKMACNNTAGVIMPCGTSQNFGTDMLHANELAKKFGIETITVDLTETKSTMLKAFECSPQSANNISPRLRMTTLYAIAQTRGSVVAGTGNKSEIFMGYFTKWGDGGCDFNPIADLYPHEVLEFLTYLDAPVGIIQKEPSAGLFEGQTDEKEMGVSYNAIYNYMEKKEGSASDVAVIERYHDVSEHKRRLPKTYGI